jgi:hypothetical protein
VGSFHKQIFDAAGNPQRMERMINMFVEGFKKAMELLRPKKVRLMGLPPRMPGIEEFSLKYIAELWDKRIRPADYDGKLSTSSPVYEGAVADPNKKYLPGGEIFLARRTIQQTFSATRPMPTTALSILPNGGAVNEQWDYSDPRTEVNARTIKEIFSGPEDIRFKWFLHILINDFIAGKGPDNFSDCSFHQMVKMSPDYQKIRDELVEKVVEKISCGSKELKTMTPEIYAYFYERMGNLPLPYPEFPPVMTFDEVLPKVWSAIKNDYPELNDDFGQFLGRCFEVWVRHEIDGRKQEGIADWGLKREDTKMISPLLARTLLENFGANEVLEAIDEWRRRYTPETHRISPEEAMELYRKLKDLPVYFDMRYLEIHHYLGNDKVLERGPALELKPEATRTIRVFPS